MHMMATIFNPLIPPSKNPRINAASWSAGPFFLLISSVFLVSIQRCLQLQLLSELQRYINEGNNISVYTCHVKQVGMSYGGYCMNLEKMRKFYVILHPICIAWMKKQYKRKAI